VAPEREREREREREKGPAATEVCLKKSSKGDEAEASWQDLTCCHRGTRSRDCGGADGSLGKPSPAPFFDVARPGGGSWVRSSLWKQGVAEAAARSEVVAGCGASDRSPDQPAPAHGERGEHVFATGAPHLASGSGSVVRLCLGQPPDPHVIRPPWKPRPGRGIALPASLLLGNGSPRRSRAPTTHKNRAGPGGEPNA